VAAGNKKVNIDNHASSFIYEHTAESDIHEIYVSYFGKETVLLAAPGPRDDGEPLS